MYDIRAVRGLTRPVDIMEWYRSGHNEHDWKSCDGQKPSEGSNPSLSAINFPPQYIRDEYIAVFVCRDMGEKWRNDSITHDPKASRFDYFVLTNNFFPLFLN